MPNYKNVEVKQPTATDNYMTRINKQMGDVIGAYENNKSIH